MGLQAQDVFRQVSSILQDNRADNRRWPWYPEYDNGARVSDAITLADLANSAVRHTISVRPDASAVVKPIQLVTGSRQSIPDDGISLLSVTRNLIHQGEEVFSPGTPVRQVERTALDSFDDDWHMQEGTSITNFVYEKLLDPRGFWVYPAVPEGDDVWIEIVYSALPDKVTEENGDIGLAGTYNMACVHHILYQIYSGDSEDSSPQRAMVQYQQFYNALEQKMTVDMTYPLQQGQEG